MYWYVLSESFIRISYILNHVIKQGLLYTWNAFFLYDRQYIDMYKYNFHLYILTIPQPDWTWQPYLKDSNDNGNCKGLIQNKFV